MPAASCFAMMAACSASSSVWYLSFLNFALSAEMLFSAVARRSSAALPNENARRRRDFTPLSLSFTAVSCLTAALESAAGLAGLGGSEGETGCDNGDGAWRLLGSGVFGVGPPATEAYVRGAGASVRDCAVVSIAL
jgi:hypothetical protein